MPSASPETVNEISQAIVDVVTYIHTQGNGRIPDALFGDDLLTVIPPTNPPELLNNAVRNLPFLSREWQSVLANLLLARDPATAERIEPVVEALRTLTKIAASEPLWAARVLAAACEGLTAAVLRIASAEVGGSNALLDTAATTIRQAFRVTVTEHPSEEPREGRTRTCYAVGVCLLRLYTRMHAYSLANGIMSAIDGYAHNIAPLAYSPPKVRIPFLFYQGMYAFSEQKYALACERLQGALNVGPEHGGQSLLTGPQFERIMAYLIPATFLTKNQTPTAETWARVPRLAQLYEPLLTATRRGDYAAFKQHLALQAPVLRGQRLYLACDLLVPKLRLNLLRRCWEILGRPKRIPIDAFVAALRAAGFASENVATVDAAEFYLSQFIVEGLVKGYIHHELQLLMVSKTQPFPTLVKPVAASA